MIGQADLLSLMHIIELSLCLTDIEAFKATEIPLYSQLENTYTTPSMTTSYNLEHANQ